MNVETKPREYITRPLEARDIPFICDAVMKYVPLLPNYHGVKMNRDYVMYHLNQSIKPESQINVILLCDSHGNIAGGVGMYCVTMLISDAKMTNDIFLFMLPEHRGLFNFIKLAEAYKAWALSKDAALIQLSHVGGYVPEEKADKLLSLVKFRRVGSIYWLNKE